MEYPQIKRVIDVIKQLRDPKTGCPWDLKQNHKSLIKYLIEESYEYKFATENSDYSEMENELGDVFLQVLLHSQIASEGNHFDLESVSKTLADKMIRRHPHVFNKQEDLSPDQVTKNWDEIKAQEKGDEEKPFFGKDDLCMPALMSSQQIGKKSAKVNFDWDNYKQVMDKVQEEWDEVKVELADPINNKERIKDEIGDLLFSVTQLARHMDIDAEDALFQANKKFMTRFTLLESTIKNDKKDMLEMTVPELEEYWAKVKLKLKN
jgi:MazG family protein